MNDSPQRHKEHLEDWNGHFRLFFHLCALCVFAVNPVSAHPVPNENHDRTILVRLTPDKVIVHYRLEIDEARAARDMPRKELAKIGSPREFHDAFCRFFADVLADNLVATLDGKDLVFKPTEREFLVTDHLRCDYRFEADWRPTAGQVHKFAIREGNYDGDDFSQLRLTLAPADGIAIREFSAPDAALLSRPAADRKPGDGEKLRNAKARFELTDVESRGSYKPALAPDAPPARSAPRRPASAARSPPVERVSSAKPYQETAPTKQLLHLLLDTRQGIFVLLLLAAGFGAAHALTPGHGKTLVAAYLVAERGTVWHAVLLGLVTTITHTGAVLIVAAVLPIFFRNVDPASVEQVFGLGGGLLIAGLGIWLLLARLTGQPDHVHLGGGHHHHHHDLGTASPPASVWGLVLLGMSGGIIPCWDAIAMLALAISAQRLWLGLPLLLAFSAGLAAVLIAIGIAVVHARNFAGSRLDRWQPLVRGLPIVSALVVTLLGLWLCYDSVQTGGK